MFQIFIERTNQDTETAPNVDYHHDLRPQKCKMPLYTLLFIVNRISCGALRTKDQDSRADGLLPIPWGAKNSRASMD